MTNRKGICACCYLLKELTHDRQETYHDGWTDYYKICDECEENEL